MYLIGAIKQGASATAFIVPSAVLVADGLPTWIAQEANMAKKTLKEWVEEFMPKAREAMVPIPEEMEDESFSPYLSSSYHLLCRAIVWVT